MKSGELIKAIMLARKVTHVFKDGKWVNVDV
jgi:hypothetical protein